MDPNKLKAIEKKLHQLMNENRQWSKDEKPSVSISTQPNRVIRRRKGSQKSSA